MASARSAPDRGRRLARLFLLAYCVFMVYGSFFPFDFTVDPAFVRAHASRIVLRPFDANGRRAFSIPDVASNLLLGVPAGLFLVAGGVVGRSFWVRMVSVALLESLFASAVEAGQMFTPGREASAIDVEAQVVGAVVGAVAGHLLLRLRGQALGRQIGVFVRRRPTVIVVAVIMLALAADSLYPYAVTLDVSTAWGNLKRAQWVPLGSFARRFWGDLVVDRGLSYVALGAAARSVVGPPARGWGAGWIWGLATGFALCLELAKLLVVGRAPNIDDVILGSAGALLGAVVVGRLARLGWVRAHAPVLLILATASLLVYQELTPFDFVSSLKTTRTKLSRIDWIPLGSYFYASSQSALFDLGKKILLGGFLGAALRAGGSRAPWAWALGLGALLEAAQLLQRSHVPSTTDVLSMTVGAALGAALVERYRPRRRAASEPTATVSDCGH